MSSEPFLSYSTAAMSRSPGSGARQPRGTLRVNRDFYTLSVFIGKLDLVAWTT